jgi:hypothetical protein
MQSAGLLWASVNRSSVGVPARWALPVVLIDEHVLDPGLVSR